METTCSLLHSGWEMQDAAPALSAVAGVAASLLFALFFLILAVYAEGNHRPAGHARAEARRAALTLLLPNILAMFVASLLFGLISGEQVCRRAATMSVPASALLGIAGVGTFIAITWLLSAYVADNYEVLRVGVWCCWVVWFLAAAEVGLALHNARHQFGGDSAIDEFVWRFHLPLVAAISLLIFLIRKHYPQLAGRLQPDVRRAAWTGLTLVLIISIVYNWAAVPHPPVWLGPLPADIDQEALAQLAARPHGPPIQFYIPAVGAIVFLYLAAFPLLLALPHLEKPGAAPAAERSLRLPADAAE
jgi:hypothetical protein